jgi:hypothetical protein
VELERSLCEVRVGQYWRLEKAKSFDDFLERRFPGSRRRAYYFMSIHEHMPKQVKSELNVIGWKKAAELVKVIRRDPEKFLTGSAEPTRNKKGNARIEPDEYRYVRLRVLERDGWRCHSAKPHQS